MQTWIVIGLMFTATVVALAYPLLRPRPGAPPAHASSPVDDLDALIERSVAARRGRGTTPVTTSSRRRTCPECRETVWNEDLFCRRCGASLAQQCPACGNPFEEGDRFCVRCGGSLTLGEPT